MKQKITITGPKVHDVGYRPFLAEMAMDLSPKGFDVYNDEVEGRQAVIALIEGDERRVRRFIDAIKTQRPPLAKVYEIKVEDYTDDIMPAWQAATTTLVKQFNKAVPILQSVSDDMKELNKGMDTLVDEVRGLREDLVGSREWQRRIEHDIQVIKAKLRIQ